MITEETIQKVRDFAFSQGAPISFHLEVSNDKGQTIAEQLGADKKVVFLGTLLMDCEIGRAIREGRQKDHIAMSAEKAREVLLQFPEMTPDEKQNVINCVLEHHRVPKFSSQESEICCNADCYRFASIKGFLGTIRYLREMEFSALLKLLNDKLEEKWNALTLDSCKKELEPQYKVLRQLLDSLT